MSASTIETQAVISQLMIYPIKSCAPVALRQVPLTDQGLDLDRTWMVVDERGQFVSQRERPRLALVQPQLRQSDLVLRAPGMLSLHLTLEGVEGPMKVWLWDEPIDAWDMGPVAAQWFSDFLGQAVRLVRFDPEQKRLSSLGMYVVTSDPREAARWALDVLQRFGNQVAPQDVEAFRKVVAKLSGFASS